MVEIKGEHEDLIFKNREFIQELSKVQDLYYETLLAEINKDGNYDKDVEDYLFDYVYNSTEEETFEEYLVSMNYKGTRNKE